jgi:hypothetical protein
MGLGCPSKVGARIALGKSDSGRSITAAEGDRIEVTLQTIGPGRYDSPILSSGSVRFLGESQGAPNPGGPLQLFRFDAVATGRADVTIPHSGESPNGPVTPPFALRVDVR